MRFAESVRLLRMTSAARSTLAALALGLVAAACGGGGDPAWRSLARGYRPAAPEPYELITRDGERLRVVPGAPEDAPGTLWITADVERAAWSPTGLPGLWTAQRPVGNFSWLQSASPSRMVASDGTVLRFVPFSSELSDFQELERGAFTRHNDALYLWIEAEREPPELAQYALAIERGASLDGVWSVPLGRWSAPGLPLWPGQSARIALDSGERSTLRFATAAIAVRATTPTDDGAQAVHSGGEVVFRVRRGEHVVFEQRAVVTANGGYERHVVALDAGDEPLAFSVEGDAAITAFLDPRVGPADPAPPARPDVILFLADTFRADNLATYGGTDAVAPAIDVLARESLVFANAWSPSVWTLPSQGSMFAGIYPPQHGATSNDRSLPAEIVTLTEHLAGNGYRTGAITDAGFISRRFGFAQGFDWFDERFRDFDESLDEALAFLDADDGRPTFLFLHTYRVHRPYRVSEQTRREHGERLGIRGYDDQMDAAALAGAPRADLALSPDELAAHARDLRALYLGGVLDLDRGFDALLDALARRDRLDSTHIVFTSDHGEGFVEHGVLGHEEGLWEEQIRIPLFVHGPGLSARRVEHAATLVDLPRTICDLAGVEPAPTWDGTSLLELAVDRPAFSFECGWRDERRLALIAESQKLIAPAEQELLRPEHLLYAYDLRADPHEREDARTRAAWPAELLLRLAPHAAVLLDAKYDASSARVGPEDEETLRMLGYLGDPR